MDDLSNIGRVKELCQRYGFTFSKGLGQNFLVNPSVCPRIAELGGASPETGVLEIGVGFGVLTVELAKRAKKVVSIEIDESLRPVLAETLVGYDNITVIYSDVLKLNLSELLQKEFEGMDVVVCANLPYYATSPILMALLEQRLPIRSITVMVQKEAAQRLCAQMGTRECGAVTAAVRWYSEPKVLFPVSRGSFLPPPNVDSAVIRLDIQKQAIPCRDEDFLFRVIHLAFAQRRKTMANPLSAGLRMPKGELLRIFQETGIKPAARAEELTLEQFAALADRLQERGYA